MFSDIPLGNLVRKICSKLFPNGKMETAIFHDNVQTIETALHELAERKNYGISDSICGSIWRWEVLHIQLFSESMRSVIQQRRDTREKARILLETLFETLSEEQRNIIISGSKDKDALEQVSTNYDVVSSPPHTHHINQAFRSNSMRENKRNKKGCWPKKQKKKKGFFSKNRKKRRKMISCC